MKSTASSAPFRSKEYTHPDPSCPIGIWGAGITGCSYVRYCQERGFTKIHLFDNKPIPPSLQQKLREEGIILYQPDGAEQFFAATKQILVSPGVPPTLSATHPDHTYHTELPLFLAAWNGPTIGITGTLGKSTITHTIAHLLKSGNKKSYACGNIGIPMLDILKEQAQGTYAVIELSSFQLMHVNTCPPTLSILSNIYPNHLDYHGSFEAYVTAKCKLLGMQKEPHRAVAPLSLIETINATLPDRAPFVWFSATPPSVHQRTALQPGDSYYYGADRMLYRATSESITQRAPLATIPGSYPENALIVQIVLDLLACGTTVEQWQSLQIPPHRCAPLRTIREIRFYNDSKATVPQATLAAVAQLRTENEQIVLFWGGVSKGIDRQNATALLATQVRLMICFGHERARLAHWCTQAGGTAQTAATLEEAVALYWQHHAQPYDKALFSPGGASFDLFENFEARGNRFTELVAQL